MRSIYNKLLAIIIIAIVVVIALIVIKYGQNRTNEKEVSKIIEVIKQENSNSEMQTEQKIEYKGYEVVGIIKIQKIGLEYPILSYTTNDTMKLSITKFWGNGVNKIGNLCLAGHNNYDGTMFGKTKNLELGDIVELTDMYGQTTEYVVYDKFITDPNDISVIEVDEFGTREVTLITCSNGNKERLIIKAREGETSNN